MLQWYIADDSVVKERYMLSQYIMTFLSHNQPLYLTTRGGEEEHRQPMTLHPNEITFT